VDQPRKSACAICRNQTSAFGQEGPNVQIDLKDRKGSIVLKKAAVATAAQD